MMNNCPLMKVSRTGVNFPQEFLSHPFSTVNVSGIQMTERQRCFKEYAYVTEQTKVTASSRNGMVCPKNETVYGAVGGILFLPLLWLRKKKASPATTYVKLNGRKTNMMHDTTLTWLILNAPRSLKTLSWIAPRDKEAAMFSKKNNMFVSIVCERVRI